MSTTKFDQVEFSDVATAEIGGIAFFVFGDGIVWVDAVESMHFDDESVTVVLRKYQGADDSIKSIRFKWVGPLDPKCKSE